MASLDLDRPLSDVRISAQALRGLFTRHSGCLQAGGDLLVGRMTIAQAMVECLQLAGCRGFTFNSSDDDPDVQHTIFFKGFFILERVEAQGAPWTSYQFNVDAAMEQGRDRGDLPSQLSSAAREVLSPVILSPHSQQGIWSDRDRPIGRASQREVSRRAVRASLTAALEASFARCGYIWIYCSFILLLGLLGLVAWSWAVYQNHMDDDCKQPLALMLKLFYAIVITYVMKREILRCFFCYDPMGNAEPSLSVRLFQRLLYVATFVWPIVAAVMLLQLKSSKDCSTDLKTVVQYITAYYAVAAFVIVAMPACTISVMLCLIRRGWIRERMDSAPTDFIENLPTIEYEASHFNDVTGVYPLSCPICLEDFSAEQPISRTPCADDGHVFHRSCLDGWLQFSRTCPLCRTDMTTAAV